MNVALDVALALAVGFLTAQLAIFVTTTYLHRGVTHGALTMHPFAALPFRFIVWVTSGIRPREWAGVHRRHHAATDTVDDPHSPKILGAWRVFLTNVWLYRKAAKDRERVARYTRDIKRDWLDRIVFDRETIGPLLGAAFLWLIFGWFIGLLAALTHAIVYVGLNGAINSVGHVHGERPNDNSATNSRGLALVTGGEALHNNHHAGATAARFSWRGNEIDPGWWVVRTLCALHLVTLRHPGGVMPALPPAGEDERVAA